MEEQPETSEPRRLVRSEATIESSFTGPLPPAETYAQYEATYPGAAARILGMAEKEQDHRIAWENKSLDYAAKAERRGQWMAYSLALGCIVGAVICSTYQQTVPSIALAVVSVSGVAARFLDRNPK